MSNYAVWPDAPRWNTELQDSVAQTWDNGPIRTVRPAMKTTI
ncbi:hypothetical protein HMPREF0970_02112 [Schaalia odontolytica F0309]|uniref:Uncharacterized protein n=1 Tax=Schaalia odontolytica F0309 TaxID=649742 RepID=D4U1L1_9ACTO|nr:hypothetical protein HMPREF0970_02112 [Schaalia odontolytica F0309]